MNHSHALFVIALVAIGGCRSARETTESEAADGLYIESSKSSTGLVVRVPHPTDGRIFTMPVKPFDGFVPLRIDILDTPDGSYVQVSGRATVERWSEV